MKRTWPSFRADLVAGLFLMLPLTVALFVLHKLWAAIHAPVRLAAERMHIQGPLMMNGLLLLSGVVLILLVWLVGRLVRGKNDGRLRRWVEEQLMSYIPGYMYIRIILGSKLGRNETPMVRPALLRTGDGWQPVFYVEPLANGRCVVYLPDVPLGASGGVLVVVEANVQVLPGSVARMDHALRRYGKGLGAVLDVEGTIAVGDRTVAPGEVNS